MTLQKSTPFNWNPTSLLEIELKTPDDFLKIKETLTRIGVSSTKENVLFQSCHILHKKGRYYCVHFKELFQLDGRPSDISVEDISRRNAIALLLQQWGLCTVISPMTEIAHTGSIKVVPYKDKSLWKLETKYSMRSDRIKK